MRSDSSGEPEYRRIVLRSHQIPHAERMEEILAANYVAGDNSVMRSGKTLVQCWLSRRLGLPLLVVCPCSVLSVWQDTCAEYGVPVFGIHNYQAISSSKGHQPTSGLLVRTETTTSRGKGSSEYIPSEKFLDMLERGVLLVFDECQATKNETATARAARALSGATIEARGRSRVCVLSGTPFDKPAMAFSLCKLMGLSRAPTLFEYLRSGDRAGTYQMTGAEDLIQSCSELDRRRTEEVVAEFGLINKRTVLDLPLRLYVAVVLPSLLSSMSFVAPKDVRNGFYDARDRFDELAAAIDELRRATNFDERRRTVEYRQGALSRITTALLRAETGKVDIFVRLAVTDLETIPGCKVLVFLNYLRNIREVAGLLADYDPIVLTGSKIPEVKGYVKPEERAEGINLFRNSPRHNLLIAQIQVANLGIDLAGEEWRRLYISPNYSALLLQQAINRVVPGTGKEIPHVRMVYVRGATQETRILDALAKKAKVLKEILPQQVADGIRFPGDFEEEVE